ncbi:hypothetical protein GCM10010368_20220 [Streptomyces roseiscleroticus]|uniref:Uncharacterized protein n=1 Tax=Streptomyces roseiscleroticus TaxID=1972 RepID=A0ABP5RAD8_9ACTN
MALRKTRIRIRSLLMCYVALCGRARKDRARTHGHNRADADARGMSPVRRADVTRVEQDGLCGG